MTQMAWINKAMLLSGAFLSSPAMAAPTAEQTAEANAAVQADAAVEANAATSSETVDSQPLEAPQPPAPAPDEVSTDVQRRAVSPAFSARRGPLPDFLIGGFAEASAAFSDKNSGSGSSFFSFSFNPALYFQYKDLLLFEGELEIEVAEDGTTETALEYGQIDLLLHDNVTLVVGKFLSPVGQYQERLHPAWINRLPTAPPGFGHDGVQPGSEVGVQVRGVIPFGGSRLTYALAAGNGPRLMEGEAALAQEGFGGDDNGNKAISGRIGFFPVPYLEVGASFLTGKVRGVAVEELEEEVFSAEAAVEDAPMLKGPNTRLKIWGLDAAYTRGPWDVRFEYLRGTRNAYEFAPEIDGHPIDVPTMKLRAWYAQAAYRLSEVTQHRLLQNLEPVVRYGEYKIRGIDELAEENNEKRWNAGLNYWFAPAIVLHGTIEHRRFTARMAGDRKDTRMVFQLGYGF